MTKSIKNILVQYKGGGYDGCYWEWNYFMFNSRGHFINLKSTGVNGVKTRQEAIDLTKNGNSVYRYKLDSKKNLREFVRETNESDVVEIGGMVNDRTAKNALKIEVECPDCGDLIKLSKKENDNYPQLIHTSERGNGGIGLIFSGYICSDCYCNNTCGYCGEFIGREELYKTESGYCKSCDQVESNKLA